MYPTDVLKTRAQLHASGSQGMAQILRGIVQAQGVAGLYRGIARPIFAAAPKRADKTGLSIKDVSEQVTVSYTHMTLQTI